MTTNDLVQEVRSIAKKAGTSKFRIRMKKGKLALTISLRIKKEKWNLVQADVFLLTRHNQVGIHYDVENELLTVTKTPTDEPSSPSENPIQ